MKVRNPFDDPRVAERYTNGRPYFHPIFIAKIRETLDFRTRVRRALDVGCGTGLSSRALLPIAELIDAVDASPFMLARAYRHAAITYQLCRAEEIDYPDSTFDLITVSQTVHWTNQDVFFGQAARVLKRGCHLVIYDDFFRWKDGENDDLAGWFGSSYLRRFPPPKRNHLPLDAQGKVEPPGFVFAGFQECANSISFTLNQLVDYLVTQSNVASSVEFGEDSLAVAIEWLTAELAPVFGTNESLTFDFGGPIYYLKRG